MGAIEEKIKVKIRKSKIQKGILYTLAALGFILLAGNSPSAARAILKALRERKIFSTYDGTRKAIKKLLKLGLIKFQSTKQGTFLQLTPRGKRTLDILEKKEFKLQKPKRWDGKWRILIFDIKERHRKIRDQFRQTLVSIGFKCLQKSVWIYPYDCEDLIVLLKADLKVGKDILYIVADIIEYDQPLRKHFVLK